MITDVTVIVVGKEERAISPKDGAVRQVEPLLGNDCGMNKITVTVTE
jgi:hypothetical protein